MSVNQSFTERFESDYNQLERIKADILNDVTAVKVNFYLDRIHHLNTAALQEINDHLEQLQTRKELCADALELAAVLFDQKQQPAYALYLIETVGTDFSDIAGLEVSLHKDYLKYAGGLDNTQNSQLHQALLAVSNRPQIYTDKGVVQVGKEYGKKTKKAKRTRKVLMSMIVLFVLLVAGIGVAVFVLPEIITKDPPVTESDIYTSNQNILTPDPINDNAQSTTYSSVLATTNTPIINLYTNTIQSTATLWVTTAVQTSTPIPSIVPTEKPSPTLTVKPTGKPTAVPTMKPTEKSTDVPTKIPTEKPDSTPTIVVMTKAPQTPAATAEKARHEVYLQIQSGGRPEYDKSQYGAYKMRIEINNISKVTVNAYTLCYTTQDPNNVNDMQEFLKSECHISDTIQQVFGPGARKYSTKFPVDVLFGDKIWIGIVGIETSDGMIIDYEPEEIQFVSWTVYQH